MKRLTRADALMGSAFLWAERSTCSRLGVGCVVAREGRILVQGYNGAPAGMPHCDHECNCNPRQFMSLPELVHEDWCNSQPNSCRAVHAEQSAIAWAAREGVRLFDADLYCTHQPCLTCARSIINAGIRSVTYQEPYRLKEGLDLLIQAGIEVIRYADGGSLNVVGSRA